MTDRAIAFLALSLSFLVGCAPAEDRVASPARGDLAPPPRAQKTYVGAEVCAQCHATIYEVWRSTRHSFSVLTADEARRAGYPLPDPTTQSTVRGWDDLLFTIGGRKRVAYVDRNGQVLPTSYHPRVGGWSLFPAKPMECGPCHHTGFDITRPNPRAPQVRGSWAELNIGCEACHGPGSRHVNSLDGADITLDISSRLCGTCHTPVNRALPRDDEFHSTHSDVQTWHQDPHVTGTKFNSTSAFCARCHSPFDGEFVDLERGAAAVVFAEEKQNITCIGCHNPHAVTNPAYRREKALLEPPLPPRHHLFKGHDGDLTTDDFFELAERDEGCVRCHSGADRIDLDHGDATCSDCHNTFRFNRTAESTIVADATRPGLSCRPCHADADHLLTVLFKDPDALQPKYIHNLLTLPAAFRDKHGFRYTARALDPTGERSTETVLTLEPLDRGDADANAGPSGPVPAALDFLAGDRHRRLGADRAIGEGQRALRTDPENLDRYFALADLYAELGHAEAAVEVIERALDKLPARVIAALAPTLLGRRPSIADPSLTPPLGATLSARLQTIAAAGEPPVRSWAQGYVHLEQQQYAEAERAFESAARAAPGYLNLRLLRAFSKLGGRNLDGSIEELLAILKTDPTHVSSRLALGMAYLEKKQLASAEKALQQVILEDGRRATAPYALAVGYLREGVLPSAILAWQICLDRDPDHKDASIELARAHRLVGSIEEAIGVYRQAIARSPADLEAHWELANLLKYVSDGAAFRLETVRGDSRDGSAGLSRQELLASLAQQASAHRDAALAEFAITLTLKPRHRPAVRQVAELLRRSGRLREALELFEWLARTEPGEWLYPYRVGTTLVELGAYDQAIEALERATSLAPSQGDIYSALGVAHLRAGQLDEATEAFEQAAVHLPFSPGLFTNLGAAYASRGEYDAARERLDRARRLGTFPLPRLHLTFTNLGLIDLRQGRLEEASKAFQHALHLAPDDSRARDLLAKMRSHAGDPAPWYRDEPFVFNEMLEIFGEITTVVFERD